METTTWGTKITPKGLIFVAAFAALGYLINQISIPLAANVTLQFGDVPILLIAATMGPIWSALGAALAYAYVVVVIYGAPATLFFTAIHFGIDGLLCKKLPPEIAIIVGQLIATPLYVFDEWFIGGFPWALIWFIQFKGWGNAIGSGVLLAIITRIPQVRRALAKYAPVIYKSWFSTKILAELEKTSE